VLEFVNFAQGFQLLVFPYGDELHLGSDDAFSGVMHLGDVGSAWRDGDCDMLKTQGRQLRIVLAFPAISGTSGLPVARYPRDPLSRLHAVPAVPNAVNRDHRVGVGTGCVVNVNRRIFFRAKTRRSVRLGKSCVGARGCQGRLPGDVGLSPRPQTLYGGFFGGDRLVEHSVSKLRSSLSPVF